MSGNKKKKKMFWRIRPRHHSLNFLKFCSKIKYGFRPVKLLELSRNGPEAKRPVTCTIRKTTIVYKELSLR